jgi:hypothetical protein
MATVHAGPVGTLLPGTCTWGWHWEDVDLRCSDPAIPGGRLCADHLIEQVHRETPGARWSA